jgi:hypothetical protein
MIAEIIVLRARQDDLLSRILQAGASNLCGAIKKL